MRVSGLALSAGCAVAAMMAIVAANVASTPAQAASRYCAQYDDGREECAYPTYRSCRASLSTYEGRCFQNTHSYGEFLDEDAPPQRVKRAKRAATRGSVNCTRYLGQGRWTDCR